MNKTLMRLTRGASDTRSSTFAMTLAPFVVLMSAFNVMPTTRPRARNCSVTGKASAADWPDIGMQLNINYGSQLAHNFSGGGKELTRYADQWAFGVSMGGGNFSGDDHRSQWPQSGHRREHPQQHADARNLRPRSDLASHIVLAESAVVRRPASDQARSADGGLSLPFTNVVRRI